MKTRLISTQLSTASVLVSAIFAASVQAGHRSDNSFFDSAKVINADPVYETVVRQAPREQCWNERVQYSGHRHYRESATPVLIGAILGGALGNELGHHKRNKQVGAVVGGLLGGSIGRDIARNNSHNNGHYEHADYEVVERCKVRHETYEEQELVGYNVSYRYKGQTYHTQTSQHPGDRLRLRVSVQPIDE